MFSVAWSPDFHIDSVTSHISSSMPTEAKGVRKEHGLPGGIQRTENVLFISSLMIFAHIFNFSMVEFAAFPFLEFRSLHSFIGAFPIA